MSSASTGRPEIGGEHKKTEREMDRGGRREPTSGHPQSCNFMTLTMLHVKHNLKPIITLSGPQHRKKTIKDKEVLKVLENLAADKSLHVS